jgi:hypothetical protein
MTKLLTKPDEQDITDVFTGDSEDISNIVDDIDAQLSSITSELGADKHDIKFVVKVYRIVENRGELAWLFDCTPAELPILQKLRDEYSGGRFECRVYKNNRIYKRIKVIVEQPTKPKDEPRKSDIAEILAAVSAQQDRQFNQLKETMMQIVGKPTTPQPSQMEMMTGMMMLMKSMKDFVSPPIQHVPSFDPEKMFDMFLKGMEMGRESGSGETGLMDIAKELIKSPLLGSLTQAATSMPPLQQPQLRPQITVPQTSGQIPAQQVTPNIQTQQEATMHNPVIVHNLKKLIEKAEKDSDPILYAEFILDNVPQNIIEQYIAREDLIEYLSSFDPRVNDHNEWFIELRDHIISVLTSPDDTGDDAGTSDIPGEITPNAASPSDITTDDPKRPDRDA